MDLAPYSGAIEAASGLANAIVSRIWPDKTKVAEIQAEVQKLIIAGEFNNELAQIQSINATMQAEAKSESWMQRSWRPTIGFTFASILINNYILLAYLKTWGIVPLTIPDNIWTAMLVILGAASVGHSWERVATAKNGNGK